MAFLSSFSSTFAVDRESAIREITRGQEVMGRVRSLLLAVASTSSNWPASAEDLFEEAFHSFTVARSILKKPRDVLVTLEQSGALPPPPVIERGGSNSCFSGKRKNIVAVEEEDDEDGGVHRTSTSVDSTTKVATALPCHDGQQRRSHGEKSINAAKFPRASMDSRTMVATTVPYDDGYQWRKYGEKVINGAKFPRGYFRCTHRNEHGCQASKLVQQVDDNDPPTFLVSYNNQHTCKDRKTSPSIVSTLKEPQLPSIVASRDINEADERASRRIPAEKKSSFGPNLRIGLPGAGNKIVKQEVEVNTIVKWK